MKTDWQATAIKILAIFTAAPRWVGALLAAEGFAIPDAWIPWWLPVSAILSVAMAAVEGWAFAYVFEAWRNQHDKDADRLLALALLSAFLFVAVLAPYIAASVIHAPLAEVLAWRPALYAWSIAVGASTIAIVASVGYAQKRKVARKPAEDEPQAAQAPAHVCAVCGNVYARQTSLAAHMRAHAKQNGRALISRAE